MKVNNQDISAGKVGKIHSASFKIFMIACFVIGGFIAYYSAKIEITALKDPNQKSLTELVFKNNFAINDR